MLAPEDATGRKTIAESSGIDPKTHPTMSALGH
jgi:hypothetical protein